MSVVVVVPARLESQRIPHKVLADVGGVPLVQRVVEGARRAQRVDRVLVATDSDAVEAALRPLGTEVRRTGPALCGTDRAAEAVRGLTAEVVVNVQGDQPLVDPATIDAIIDRLGDLPMATGCVAIDDCAAFRSPDVVKVVPDARGLAVSFSRAPIPWPRGVELAESGPLPDGVSAWRHLGIYAFSRQGLETFARLPPHPLELQEGLEQLRALAHGWPIGLVQVGSAARAVDTAADLAHARSQWEAQRA